MSAETRGQVLRVDHARPVRRRNRVVLGVAEHRLPARREPGAVVERVVIPEAVVGTGQGQVLPLLDAGEAFRKRDALEPARQAGATSLSSRCRFTSQPSRGWPEANARKPRTTPCTPKAISSNERMPRPARRAASAACSARTSAVSRNSMMRTCSRRERIQGSASSDSPLRTSGRHSVNRLRDAATESMRPPAPSSSARNTTSVPVASRRMSRFCLMTGSALAAVRFWKSTATLVQVMSMPRGGRVACGCQRPGDRRSEAVKSGSCSLCTVGTWLGSPAYASVLPQRPTLQEPVNGSAPLRGWLVTRHCDKKI